MESKEVLKSRVFNFNHFKENFVLLLQKFEISSDYKEQSDLLKEINDLRFEFESAKNTAALRHVQDFNDKEVENQFRSMMANQPDYQELVKQYYLCLLKSPFRKQLEKVWGKQLFRLAEVKVESFSDSVSGEIKLENELTAEYGKLLGTAKVDFQGEKVSLPVLGTYMASSTREIRQKAFEARAKFFKENEEKFDDILDKLVRVRTKIARKLGKENFIKLGYERMNRTDIAPEDMRTYREQVKKHGVAFVSSLREKQRASLGVTKLKYYDDKVFLAEGSPAIEVPKEVMDKMEILFSELSSETAEFYNELIEGGNIDLFPRDGKQGGGFATYIGKEKKPFIFANFAGIPNDIRLFTHEAGHAFQFYMSRNLGVPEYIIPVDSAELFSFSMERFSWPWLDSFFGDKTGLYKLLHLTEAFLYMPQASMIDEFEHYLYEHPEADKNERKKKWRELEKIYLPELDYDGNEYLENGGGLHGVAHMYFSPFYFIDYDLAHFGAVQLWQKSQEDYQAAWRGFLNMSKAGGSRTFKEHLEAAGLKSPFEKGALSSLFASVEEWIKQQEISC